MRKALLTLLMFALAIGLAVVVGVGLMRRDNAQRVKRALQIVDELQRLKIGKSDHTVADSIAAEFGSAPPPKGFGGRYNKENCAAPNHLDHCTYIILMNNSPVEMMFAKYRFLPRLGLREWWGNAQIGVAGGVVENSSFWVRYKASNGQWRGAANEVNQVLPRFQTAQAHISDSYSVQAQRIDTGDEKSPSGFRLESDLTPTASAEERLRALDTDFSCLARWRGCGEVAEVMPEAWKDFVEKCRHCYVMQMNVTSDGN